jgi:thiol-disulfide isomerase/thioredoxin
MPPGIWRATLSLEGSKPGSALALDEKSLQEIRNIKIDEIDSGELPFLFEVVYPSPDSFYIEIINGVERIRVTDISFGRSIRIAKDTIEIHFPNYRTMIKATVEDQIMEGYFLDFGRGKDYRIPFVAKQGENYRFTQLKKNIKHPVGGSWKTTFQIETDKTFPGEAQFELDGNKLTGTFTTETGDYRYLAGSQQADKIYLSVFDGSHAFLFEGKVFNTDSIIGSFRSGIHYQCYWKATPGEAELTDPFSIMDIDTGIKYDLGTLLRENFSIANPAFQHGKPLILEVMGTWCPNCKDAALDLKKIQEDFPDVQVLSLAFERKNLKAIEEHLNSYQNKLNLNYPIYYGGIANKDTASSKLPFVEHIYSFPSLFFFDKSGYLRNSYSGFYGPATKEYRNQYEQLVKSTNQLIKSTQ